MSFLDRFLRKQKEKQLEKQADKQHGVPKVLKSEKSKKVKKEGKVETPIKPKAKIKSKFQIDVNSVLIKPLITEKISDGAALGKYAFMVAPASNKLSIKKAVSNLYGVEVLNVRVINSIGKSVRYGRTFGKRKDWKKAIVTLAPGEKIEIYEGV